jgi:hypothetical protein
MKRLTALCEAVYFIIREIPVLPDVKPVFVYIKPDNPPPRQNELHQTHRK